MLGLQTCARVPGSYLAQPAHSDLAISRVQYVSLNSLKELDAMTDDGGILRRTHQLVKLYGFIIRRSPQGGVASNTQDREVALEDTADMGFHSQAKVRGFGTLAFLTSSTYLTKCLKPKSISTIFKQTNKKKLTSTETSISSV